MLRRRQHRWRAPAYIFTQVGVSVRAASGMYALSQSYIGRDFFSKWRFWTAPDPSHGFAEYVGFDEALAENLIDASDDRAYIGVGAVSKQRRRSVRIQSTMQYNSGLFIIEVEHVPTGCGLWPALWMYGESPEHEWPTWGEYDIIEGVHTDAHVMTSLHTDLGCDQAKAPKFSSRDWLPAAPGFNATNCYVQARGQWFNQGCSQRGPAASMGMGFNARGGGTFAAEWDPAAQHIRTWFWHEGLEPEDVRLRVPEPDTWNEPYSFFSLAPEVCEASHFANMRLVIDTTFCGDLAEPSFDESCRGVAHGATCEEFIATDVMQEAYWSLRSFDVYHKQGNPLPVAPPTDMVIPIAGDDPSFPGNLHVGLSPLPPPLPPPPPQSQIIPPAFAEAAEPPPLPTVSPYPTMETSGAPFSRIPGVSQDAHESSHAAGTQDAPSGGGTSPAVFLWVAIAFVVTSGVVLCFGLVACIFGRRGQPPLQHDRYGQPSPGKQLPGQRAGSYRQQRRDPTKRDAVAYQPAPLNSAELSAAWNQRPHPAGYKRSHSSVSALGGSSGPRRTHSNVSALAGSPGGGGLHPRSQSNVSNVAGGAGGGGSRAQSPSPAEARQHSAAGTPERRWFANLAPQGLCNPATPGVHSGSELLRGDFLPDPRYRAGENSEDVYGRGGSRGGSSRPRGDSYASNASAKSGRSALLLEVSEGVGTELIANDGGPKGYAPTVPHPQGRTRARSTSSASNASQASSFAAPFGPWYNV